MVKNNVVRELQGAGRVHAVLPAGNGLRDRHAEPSPGKNDDEHGQPGTRTSPRGGLVKREPWLARNEDAGPGKRKASLSQDFPATAIMKPTQGLIYFCGSPTKGLPTIAGLGQMA